MNIKSYDDDDDDILCQQFQIEIEASMKISTINETIKKCIRLQERNVTR